MKPATRASKGVEPDWASSAGRAASNESQPQRRHHRGRLPTSAKRGRQGKERRSGR